MPSPGWQHYRAPEVCPICNGHPDWCQRTLPGRPYIAERRSGERVEYAEVFWCMRPPAGGAPGFRAITKPAAGTGSQKFVPEGDHAAVATRTVDHAAEQKAQAERDAQMTAIALRLWETTPAQPKTLAVKYFEARGIPRVPESALAVLRGRRALNYKDAEDRGASPAVLIRVDDLAGTLRAVHRIYLDRADPTRKRQDVPVAKKALGPLKGAAVRLRVEPTDATLYLTEGVETAVAVLAATGQSTLACISGVGLTQVALPQELSGPVESGAMAVVIAADFDEVDDARGERPGHAYARRAAARLRQTYPGARVRIAMPCALPAQGTNASGGSVAWGAGGAGMTLAPTSDWLDVVKELGLDVARAGLEAAVAPEDLGDGPGSWPGVAESSPASEPGREDGGANGLGGDGRDGGGNGNDDEGPDLSDPDNPPGLILPDSDLRRARMWLRNFRPEQTAGERHLVSYHGATKQWLRYTGTHWEAVDKDRLAGHVLRFFDNAWTWKGSRDKGRWHRASLSQRIAHQVVAAAEDDVLVASPSLPAWVPATLDDQGRAVWDSDRAVRGSGGPPVIAMRSGLLDLDGIGRSVVRLLAHTPRYCGLHVRGFDIDAGAIQAEFDRDRDGVDAGRPLCERLCPEWLKLVDELSHGEVEWGECLQRWFGLCLTPDMAHERMLWLIGSKRSGKGTIIDALTAILGDEACASTSLDDLTRPFERSAWVGRLALMIDEAQPGRNTDHVASAAMLKRITGRAPVSIDYKHRDIIASQRLSVRITLTANTLPKLLDSSNALASRIIALPVDRLGEIDPDRKRRILEEVPGIFAWALFGLRELARGAQFTLPPRGKKMLADYERLSSSLHAFVSDCVVVPERERASGYAVREDVLNALYQAHCRASGVHPVSRDRLVADLISLVPWVRREVRGEQVGFDDRMRVPMIVGVRPLMIGDELDEAGAIVKAMPKVCESTDSLLPMGFPILAAGAEKGQARPDDLAF